ncbi:MAG: protein kinase [Phycisphaerae bacterium]|nr:protein kinase [Phycisphaerae bacterium]
MADIWNDNPPPDSSEFPKPPAPLSSTTPQGAERALVARGIPFGSGLGKYRILDRIRNSHHAIIYNARDAMLDRLVVIKQLNPGLLDDPLACGDFKREAQLLARVPKDARNVVGIHELIADDQGLFIVEEFVSGDWLESLISKRKVGPADALRLLKYGCLGLRSLHSRKIVHRDIVPSNLLMSPNGQVRIANFSCAVHEGDHTPPPVIQFKYAAPELQMGMPHDDRVDIYGLGVSVYEVCVGRRALHAHFAHITRDPLGAAERWRQWHCDMSAALPKASALNRAVPPALAVILAKMTAKDIDERYATAEEVLQDIIRKFNAPRANASPTVGRTALSHVVESRSELPGTANQAKTGGPPSLLHLLPTQATTTTHRISLESAPEPAAKQVAPVIRHAKSAPAAAANRTSTESTAQSRRGVVIDRTEKLTQRPAVGASTSASAAPATRSTPIATERASIRSHKTGPVKRRVSEPQQIPIPAPTEDPPKRKRPILIPVAATIMLLIAGYMGSRAWWNELAHRPALSSLQSRIEDGLRLYHQEQYEQAGAEFLEVIVAASSDPELASAKDQAETMQLLVEGEVAFRNDQLDRVERMLDEARLRGSDLPAFASLSNKLKAKRRAIRLASEGIKAAESGDFEEAEDRLPAYEASASVAGLDPASLREAVQREREDRDYGEALQRARKALAENDFDAAQLACREAILIRQTDATRQLAKDIADGRTRYSWMVRGDKAMQERDYSAAESAYQSANAIDPSEQVEAKLKMASSMRLYNEARDAIKSGDLLEAKKKLDNALWKYPNKQARAKLIALSKAFDAAALVANADQELKMGNIAEAIRLYEKAIPDLVAPADDIAKSKLQAAKRQALIQADKN